MTEPTALEAALHEIHKDQPLFGFPMTCEELAAELEKRFIFFHRHHTPTLDGDPKVEEVQPS